MKRLFLFCLRLFKILRGVFIPVSTLKPVNKPKPAKELEPLPVFNVNGKAYQAKQAKISIKGRAGFFTINAGYIVNEYSLIERKISKLNRIRRDAISKLFEQNFEEVQNGIL